MRCCVPACKNDSRHISKSQGITFHVFPSEPSTRAAWLQVLGKEGWEPKDRSVVCSGHFLSEDLYYTRSGMRKVKAGAVPIAVQDSTTSGCGEQATNFGEAATDYGETVSLEVCRICLATDVNMFSIATCKLEEAYENLTGASLDPEDVFPKTLCAECVQRLRNHNHFRNKSLRSNYLMLQIVEHNDSLTLQDINAINRSHNQLVSNLTTKHYSVNYCDIYIDNTIETTIDKTQTEELTEVKNEQISEVFIDNIELKGSEHSDIDTGYYLASDVEYSSDDNIPLEAQRQKKEKTKKKTVRKTKVTKIERKETKIELKEPKIDRRRKPFLNDDLNETLFTVTDLTIDEQIADVLKRQESSNYKNAIFKCTECFKGFLDEDAYHGHMVRHTDASGIHRCPVCKTHFRHPHALRKHVTAHHTQRFSCNRCPYVTTHRQTARLHERWHKGTKYQCPHCQDEFVKFTTYMGHIRIKHPSDFVCELCGYSFVSAKGIELHKKLKHRLDDKMIPSDGPQCGICQVRFVSVEAHRRHIRARHPPDDEGHYNKPGRPKNEDKERASRNTDGDASKKKYYTRAKKVEGPIPCEQCGLQLEDSRAYHGHFRRMHPDKNRTNYPSMRAPCMCEVCGRMFQSYALLKDHTWVHTGERPFKCDSCGKAFRMKQRLVAHRRIHSQEKATYGCSLCGKQFSTHSNRQRHMFIHTGLKPFKCEMCGKGFKHSSEKRAHIGYVHLKKPWPKRTRGKRRTDTRQVLLPPQQSAPIASEVDIQQPWPCDPKIQDIHSPMYYNLKI